MVVEKILVDASNALITLVLLVLIPPVMDGVRRKIFGFLQRRIGPPVLQTWYDLLKLLGRRSSSPITLNIMYYASPALSLCFAVLASLMIAVPRLDSLLGGVFGFVMLVEASVASLVLGVAGLSPFTSTGSSRLLLLSGMSGAGVLMALYSTCLSRGAPPLVHEAIAGGSTLVVVLCFAALLLSSIVEFELPPFNVAEAGPEIAAGPYTEYHGPLLALALLSSLYRGFLLMVLGSAVILGPTLEPRVLSLVSWVIMACGIHVLESLVSGLFGRPRPLRAAGLASASLVLGGAALASVLLSLP